MRVLVTGHNGYIGSVLTRHLLEAGHEIVGLDTGYFRECTLLPDEGDVPGLWKDLRDLERADLESFEAVIHLAALSNDPLGDLNSQWTDEINHEATVRLARLCKSAGVRRFLFSSSCIMYGAAETNLVSEESALDPRTDYAVSKVRAERAVSKLADEDFSPTFLRNGTVYGLSPRMRFDTVLNDLVGSALTAGKVVLRSDGTPWRPVVNVKDVARAFSHVLEAPIDVVHNQAFNTGADHLNHRIIELAEIVVGLVPGCELEVLARPGADQRTYRADFGKFARSFPDFTFEWSADDGARELSDGLQTNGLTPVDYEDRRFTRLKWLRFLLTEGRLDRSLRWQRSKVHQD
jgi:nucleoside-diphosphate-sugar epimerase